MRVGDIEDKGGVTLESTVSLSTTFPTPSKKGILCKFTVKYIIYGSSYKDITVRVPSNINLLLLSHDTSLYNTMILFANKSVRFRVADKSSLELYYTYLF